MKTQTHAKAEFQQPAAVRSVKAQNGGGKSVLVDNRLDRLAQFGLMQAVGNMPYVVAQRQWLVGMFGNAVQHKRPRAEEELLQGKLELVQRQEPDDRELQMKNAHSGPAQFKRESGSPGNDTGLPDRLKSGIQSLSGISMDNVNVHYNSSRPEQLRALAYAQGSDIHVAPGQEEHLPHEAWHVVQQAQGRVRPTMQMKDGVPVNDDEGLEHEADAMGAKALTLPAPVQSAAPDGPLQLKASRVVQLGATRKSIRRAAKAVPRWHNYPPRDWVRVQIRADNDQHREIVRRAKVQDAAKMGAYRRQVRGAIATHAGHPVGSYAHGRWMYLSRQLQGLGTIQPGQDLLDFDRASVEVDHSPHDASQRNGARAADPASLYRVAVPLPRAWHRRHKTTHGAGATRHDTQFADDQSKLVNNNQYHLALENHLLETFSDGAIGETGHKKVNEVMRHANNAITYAASNIPVSIHPNHRAGNAAITAADAVRIRQSLHARIEILKSQNRFKQLQDPF